MFIFKQTIAVVFGFFSLRSVTYNLNKESNVAEFVVSNSPRGLGPPTISQGPVHPLCRGSWGNLRTSVLSGRHQSNSSEQNTTIL